MDQLRVQIIADCETPDWNNYKYKINIEIHMKYYIPVENIQILGTLFIVLPAISIKL